MMSPIDKTLAAIQAECQALRKTEFHGVRLESYLDTMLDMIDVLAAELRVINTVLEDWQAGTTKQER